MNIVQASPRESRIRIISQLGSMEGAEADPIPDDVAELVDKLARLQINKERDLDKISYDQNITAFKLKSIEPYRELLGHVINLIVRISLPCKKRTG